MTVSRNRLDLIPAWRRIRSSHRSATEVNDVLWPAPSPSTPLRQAPVRTAPQAPLPDIAPALTSYGPGEVPQAGSPAPTWGVDIAPAVLAAIATSVLHAVVEDASEPNDVDTSSRSREESLLRRQSALQEEAGEVLSELDLHSGLASYNAVLVTGSFVSGLMVWRDHDVMLLGGPGCRPPTS